MLATQRAFLGEILDYAGLFPPAQLPLDTAFQNYVRYRSEPESWMLARFICPALRLHDLEPYVHAHFTPESPLRLAALGRGGDTPAAFLDDLQRDLEAIVQFNTVQKGAAMVECFETRLPPSVMDRSGPAWPAELLVSAAVLFGAQGLATLPRFYELPLTGDWHAALSGVGAVLARLNHPAAAKSPAPLGGPGTAGLKLRCGGPDPAAIPTVDQVVTVMEECLRTRAPLKFTASLHQPTRRVDPALGVHVHGFLNLFAAAILGLALGLEHHDLMAIVDEQDVKQFTFTDEVFAWSDAEVTLSEIAHARRHQVISFGSCSFDEPRDGLRELGLI